MSPRYNPTKIDLDKWQLHFDAAIERLLNSPNPQEREALFVGQALYGEHPVMFPRSLLLQHGHILGDPGSNKSSKGLAPLIAQLIANAAASVCVIDLKGDMALFHGTRIEAERAGLPFKVFTNRVGWESNVFNPLAQSYLDRTNISQRAEHQISALGLEFGDMYGASFFSSQMEMFLRQIMNRYRDSISSFSDLYRFSSDVAAYKGLGPQSDWLNARHLHAVLHRLAGLLELNATQAAVPDRKEVIANQIQVEDILTRPTVVYFFLQSPIVAVTTRCIAKLFLYALLQAASILQHVQQTVETYVVIDEAQQLVSQSLPMILAMARSHKIGCVLSHQSLDQLKLGDLDLTQIFLSTTAFKQVFRASDLISREYLTKSAGEARYHDLSWSQEVPFRNGEPIEDRISARLADRAPFSVHPLLKVSERVGPALDVNTIMEISADPALSFVNFTEDRGFANYRSRWTPVVSGYHISKEEYDERNRMPWPSGDPSRIVVPLEWNSQRLPPPPPSGKVDLLNRRIQRNRDDQRRLDF